MSKTDIFFIIVDNEKCFFYNDKIRIVKKLLIVVFSCKNKTKEEK